MWQYNKLRIVTNRNYLLQTMHIIVHTDDNINIELLYNNVLFSRD